MEKPAARGQKTAVRDLAHAVMGEREAISLTLENVPADEFLDRVDGRRLRESRCAGDESEVEVAADHGGDAGQQIRILRELVEAVCDCPPDGGREHHFCRRGWYGFGRERAHRLDGDEGIALAHVPDLLGES